MNEFSEWPSECAQFELERFLDARGFRSLLDIGWEDFAEMARRVERFIGRGVRELPFFYEHRLGLEPDRKPYSVRMSMTCTGNAEAPLVLCLGGIANSARRFDILAGFLAKRYRVVALDWAGRGNSGWLSEMMDYGFESSVAQARSLLDHLGGKAACVIGSSLGGSVGIRLAAETPDRIGRLVLNDVGPVVPIARRQARARVIGRHYVFVEPTDFFRRTGAAQKKDGPVEDAVLLHNALHITRWSKEDGGRVYRHDIRALLAYREEVKTSFDLSPEWNQIRCPVLILHGVLSDNLTEDFLKPLTKLDHVWIRHVPQTGHTPILSDPVTVGTIGEWLAAPPGGLVREAMLPELPASYPRRLFLPAL